MKVAFLNFGRAVTGHVAMKTFLVSVKASTASGLWSRIVIGLLLLVFVVLQRVLARRGATT